MSTSEPSIRKTFFVRIFKTRLPLSDTALLLLAIVLLAILSIRSAPVLAIKSRGADPASQLLVPVHLADQVLNSRIPGYAAKTDTYLVQSLSSGHSTVERLAAMAALQARPSSTSLLLSSLTSHDASLRLAAVQVLGWQRATSAVDALIGATFDPSTEIRESAIIALGDIGSVRAIPRLQQAQIIQSNFYVQEAAFLAEQRILADVASELSIGTSELHGIAVAPLSGWAFAVTSQGLFVRRDSIWEHVQDLPAQLTDVVATDANGSMVFVGTRTGLYRSLDGAQTLQGPVAFPVSTPALVTAAAVNPKNSRQIYVALASTTARLLPAAPLGIYASTDGGNTWSFLPDSPRDYVTTRLSLDPAAPKYLFGATGVGTWRYTLSDGASGSRAN